MTDELLGQGRFLRLSRRDGWEVVDRIGVDGIVVVVAVTAENEIVLVEQDREPVRSRVIELPAGLAGDDGAAESLAEAAGRELLEETGFRARRFTVLTAGPPSAGLTSEVVTLMAAHDVERVGVGGGVDGEAIEVHLVPLVEAENWLRRAESAGRLVDPKVWAGLWFATKAEREP